MSGNVLRQTTTRGDEPFERALDALVVDWRKSGRCSQSDKALILALSNKVSAAVRARLLEGLEDELVAPGRRGGPIFENVIYLINERSEWTAAVLRRKLAEHGQHISAKTLSNCIGYLVKSGRLIRVARGRYVVAGAGIVSADPIVPQYDIEKGGVNED